MPEFAPYSLRVAFVARIVPSHTESTKPLHGGFGGVLGGMDQKGGSEYRQNRSQLPNVKNVEVFAYIGTNRPQPKTCKNLTFLPI